MNLKVYLDLYALLQSDDSNRSERRTFGLTHAGLKENPTVQLMVWVEERRSKLKKPLLSDTLSTYLYGITLTLVIFAFILGVLSGIGLLRYNGHEPVNVIYFMAMVIFVPLFTMTLSLLSMLKANSARSMLVHISPAFWMERILSLFPSKMEKQVQRIYSELKVNPLLLNWLVIKRSQLLALAFSSGLLVSLLAMVSTQDIAFAWSTTLSVSAESFQHFLQQIAFAWRDLFPWAVPSVELVEKSQYYRLGEKLGKGMIEDAAFLGEWWKFLLFATLFYAIFLRFLLYLLASMGLKRAIAQSFNALEGVPKLLNDMNEPIISTGAREDERIFDSQEMVYPRMVHTFDTSYDVVLGWALDKESCVLINESMHIISPTVEEVGGANSLDEDKEVIVRCHGEVLLYVKAWEPPTMDFIDFLELLLQKADKVLVAPLGTQNKGYLAKEKDLNVWARKLLTLNAEKVWLKVSGVKVPDREALNADS